MLFRSGKINRTGTDDLNLAVVLNSNDITDLDVVLAEPYASQLVKAVFKIALLIHSLFNKFQFPLNPRENLLGGNNFAVVPFLYLAVFNGVQRFLIVDDVFLTRPDFLFALLYPAIKVRGVFKFCV